MPTTFYVYYSQKNKFSRNESDYFLECLAEAYADYFSEKYSEYSSQKREKDNKEEISESEAIV